MSEPPEDALCEAAQKGELARVKKLLGRGLPLDARDFIQDTPLISAASGGQARVVTYLLDQGAQLDAVNRFGRDALSCATTRKVAELLLARGAVVDRADKEGRTALTRACWSGPLAKVEVLLEHGADPTARGEDGKDGLILASEAGQPEIVARLLRAGADPAGIDGFGNTALHRAARQGHVGACEALLDGGAPLEAEDSSRRTPLALAASTGREAVVRLLLGRGARVGGAARSARTEAIRRLLHELPAQGSKELDKALLLAVAGGRGDEVEAALAAGASPSSLDAQGRSVLAIARALDDWQVRALVEAASLREAGEPELLAQAVLGGPLGAGDQDPPLLTRALELATTFGHPGLLAGLLRAGAEPGDAVALAIQHRRPQCLTVLLLSGAPPAPGDHPQSGAGSECARLNAEARSGRLMTDAPLWGSAKVPEHCPICSALPRRVYADLEQGESLPDDTRRLVRSGRDRRCPICDTRYRFTRETGWYTTGYETDESLERL